MTEQVVEQEDIDLESASTDEVEMFGENEARWYQVAARNGVADALEHNPKSRVLVVLPTGAGKTLTSGLIFSCPRIRKALGITCGRPLRLLFIAHKHRLLTQAERTYADAENVDFIAQSAFSSLDPSLFDEQGKPTWDIACIDEAHHEAMVTIQYHLELLGNKPILGLTATPDRADGCLIKFEHTIEPITREQAVAEGYLAPTRIHSFVDTPSKDKVEILTDIFTNYGDQMGQTMVFVRTKKEVRALHHILKDLGYDVVSILDQTDAEVDQILDDFSEGRYKFVLNCNKINEGVDVKGCTDVVLGRQFGSYPQLNQVIGRASRPDSDCNVWELINPLSARNLDTTVVVGTPEFHRLVSKEKGKWEEYEFDYTGVQRTGIQPVRSTFM